MLRSIRIQNYRGIAEGHVENLGRVNLFVGPNGSGKSTVLEAVFLGASGRNPSFDFEQKPIIQLRHNEDQFPSPHCWYRRDRKRTLEMTYGFPDHSASLRINDVGSHPLVSAAMSSYFPVMRFLDIRMLLSKALEWQSWDALVQRRGDRMLRRVMGDVYGLAIESFTYSPSEQVLLVLFSDRDYALRVDDLGAGMRIALRLFMSVLLCKDSAVLAEEFDGYQHIESFPRFVRTLSELSRVNNTQLFLATHSLETIGAFVEEATERPETDLRVYQTSLNPDGNFQAAGLTAEDAATLVAGGFDVRRSK